MRRTRYSDLDWVTRPDMGNDGHPKDKKTQFKLLQKGMPGEPALFEMVVTTNPVPKSVKRHRQHTDQYRYSLKGKSPWAPGVETAEGSLLFIRAEGSMARTSARWGSSCSRSSSGGSGRSPFVDFESLHEAPPATRRTWHLHRRVHTEVTASGARRRVRAGTCGWWKPGAVARGFGDSGGDPASCCQAARLTTWSTPSHLPHGARRRGHRGDRRVFGSGGLGGSNEHPAWRPHMRCPRPPPGWKSKPPSVRRRATWSRLRGA